MKNEKVKVLVMSDFLGPRGLYPARLLVHGILQARLLEWDAMPSSRGSSQPGIEPASPALQADYLLSEAPGKPL